MPRLLFRPTSRKKETLFLLELAERSDPQIAGVVGWVDLRSRRRSTHACNSSRNSRSCAASATSFKPSRTSGFLLRADFARGIARLANSATRTTYLIYPKHLPAAIELATKFPEQRFVIDHIAKPEIKSGNRESWSADIRSIAARANVFCKLSGLITEADWEHWTPADFAFYLDVVFEAFGPERLMFGSDWPVCLLAGSYEQVKQLIEDYVGRHAAGESEKIFGGNAIRFYGLKTSTHGLAA